MSLNLIDLFENELIIFHVLNCLYYDKKGLLSRKPSPVESELKFKEYWMLVTGLLPYV